MCDHHFIGTREGVRCSRCGLSMTPEQWAEFQNPEPKEPKGSSRRRKKEEADHD